MNTQPYKMDPRGDGIRYPIRQAPLRERHGSLDPSVSATLYRRRGAMPMVMNAGIRGVRLPVGASSMSQAGQGRRRRARKVKVPAKKIIALLYKAYASRARKR